MSSNDLPRGDGLDAKRGRGRECHPIPPGERFPAWQRGVRGDETGQGRGRDRVGSFRQEE